MQQSSMDSPLSSGSDPIEMDLSSGVGENSIDMGIWVGYLRT
jgi:hypothetical protein